MESFDIPTIKQEQITPAPTVSQEDKYSQFMLGGSSSYQMVPQFLSQETGIYLLPIEQPSNNPYKQQDQTDEGYSMMFQKFPSTSDYQNWSSSSANFMPSFLPPYNKEKSLEKEDDFLAQLLDVGGFENDMYTPSNDMFIPLQSESPLQTNCFSPQSSPMQLVSSYPSPQYDDLFINEVEDINGVSPVLLGGEESDPLVSDVNEVTLSPSNEMLPLSNEVPQPTDDLQDILGELFGEDDFSLSNSFGQSYSPDDNIIPISTSFPNTVVITDDETNRKPIQAVEEDIIIPSFDSPPTTKKPRMSDSSSVSMEDFPRAMDIPVPPPDRSSSSSSPTNPSTQFSFQDVPTNASPKAQLPGSNNTLLFGQHEDDIIQKLLTPQYRNGTKPIARDKLVTMAVEEFNAILDEGSLTEIEVAFMKEWRRRGKNKMAAQIARKRKREELYVLEDDMDTLHQKRAQLQQSVDNLKIHIASYKRRSEAGERKIYKHYSTAHGSLVSEKTHTIHVTDDGKTMLIPRMSTQILLV